MHGAVKYYPGTPLSRSGLTPLLRTTPGRLALKLGAPLRWAGGWRSGLAAGGLALAGAAATKIQRKWRNKRVTRKRMGETPNFSNCKRTEIRNTNTTGHDTRTLYAVDVTQIPRADVSGTTISIDERIRNLVNYRGFKLCFHIRNDTNKPIMWHCAVIQAKNDTAISITDFFRGNATERGVNLNTALSFAEYDCLPINTDKFYVLHHWRRQIQMAVATSDEISRSGKNYYTFMKYVKIGRQLRYDAADTSPERPIYLVHWSDQYFSDKITDPVASALQMQIHITAFWRETK